MRKYILVCLLLVSCAAVVQAQDRITIDGRFYPRAPEMDCRYEMKVSASDAQGIFHEKWTGTFGCEGEGCNGETRAGESVVHMPIAAFEAPANTTLKLYYNQTDCQIPITAPPPNTAEWECPLPTENGGQRCKSGWADVAYLYKNADGSVAIRVNWPEDLVTAGEAMASIGMEIIQPADDSCWKNSYGRGVGTIPDVCVYMDRNSSGCVPWCGMGYDGFGQMICTRAYVSWVPGLEVAAPFDSDLDYNRGVLSHLGECAGGTENDAGLCYQPCEPGTYGVGPVCWGECPSGWVGCGAMCTKNEEICAQATSDIVLSSLGVLANVFTAGASSQAVTAGKNAAKQSLRQAVRQAAKNNPKTVLALEKSIDAGGLAWVVSEKARSEEKRPEVYLAELTKTLASTVDPTGVIGLVNSLNRPICGDVVAAAAEATIAEPLPEWAQIDEVRRVGEPGVWYGTTAMTATYATPGTGPRLFMIQRDHLYSVSPFTGEYRQLRGYWDVTNHMAAGLDINADWKLWVVQDDDLYQADPATGEFTWLLNHHWLRETKDVAFIYPWLFFALEESLWAVDVAGSNRGNTSGWILSESEGSWSGVQAMTGKLDPNLRADDGMARRSLYIVQGEEALYKSDRDGRFERLPGTWDGTTCMTFAIAEPYWDSPIFAFQRGNLYQIDDKAGQSIDYHATVLKNVPDVTNCVALTSEDPSEWWFNVFFISEGSLYEVVIR